jgi:hypothetical protein
VVVCRWTLHRILEERTVSKLVIVGEMNPYGSDPSFALYPFPVGASGDRLRRIMGLGVDEYIDLDRVNLCTGKWSMPVARAEFARIAKPCSVYVALGRKVITAMATSLQFFEHDGSILSLPHPSGLNRMWMEPGAVQRARDALATIAPWVPWGHTRETL